MCFILEILYESAVISTGTSAKKRPSPSHREGLFFEINSVVKYLFTTYSLDTLNQILYNVAISGSPAHTKDAKRAIMANA